MLIVASEDTTLQSLKSAKFPTGRQITPQQIIDNVASFFKENYPVYEVVSLGKSI